MLWDVPLGPEATADQVAEIIGNRPWTDLRCHECGTYGHHAVVEVGDPPDYESCTASLCLPCARKAVEMLENVVKVPL